MELNQIIEYKTLVLRNGDLVKIDEEDYENFSKSNWFLSGNYVLRYLKSDDGLILQRMHRLVVGAKMSDLVVDHINGDTLDNRRCNLRICSPAENAWNRRLNSNNTTGYKGVYFKKSRGMYFARIVKGGKRYASNYYFNKSIAARTYDVLAKKYFGEYAYLNFPN